MDSLPSLDYAMYLMHTVKFHISQTYHLLYEPFFLDNMQLLYEEGPQPITAKNRLWYVQYFLIMAFGKALLVRNGQGASASANEYFFRAMDLFPEIDGLYQDPVLSVEICCGLALYLQAIDHRNSAYVYVSYLPVGPSDLYS